jgi:hypothetical protein
MFNKARLLKLITETSLLIGRSRLLNHLLDCFGFADFIKTNQTILNGKDLFNCRVRKQIALQIFDDLMNANNVSIVFVRLEFQRLKLSLNTLKLISLIFAHRVASINETAFQSVRPFHVRVHHRNDCFNLAFVESIV